MPKVSRVPEGMHQFTIRLPVELATQLRVLADITETSLQELIATACKTEYARRSARLNEAGRAALRDVLDYRLNGAHGAAPKASGV